MKRTIRTILCAAAVILAAVSCQKFNLEEGRKGTIDIRIGGLMGEYAQTDGTKSSLVNTIRVSWEQGDVIYVFDGTQCLGSLVASLDGTEDRIALLSTDAEHTVESPTEGTTQLTLIHSPLLSEAPSVSEEGVVSISLANQSGEKAPFVAYATMDYNNETSIENAVVPFHFATSIIKVNCTGLKANTAINSASLNNVNTTCQLSLSGTAAPTIDGGVKGSITRTGDAYFAASKINAEGEAVFQIAVPKLATADARVLTVKQGNNYSQDKKFTEKSLNSATSVNTVCQLVALPAGALPGVFSVRNDDGANIKQIYFSYGNLWYGPATEGAEATFNLEANQAGSSFSGSHKSYFYWAKSSTDAIMDHILTTNNNQVTDVFFTNDTETTTKDGFSVNVDGAAQSGWRTLSKNEWEYLLNTRTMKYGKDRYSADVRFADSWVKGIVIYPDDYDGEPLSGIVANLDDLPHGVVYLPGAGYVGYRSDMEDFYYYYDAGYGYYWTSSACDATVSYPTLKAYCLQSRNGNYNSEIKNTARNQGSSIRLVKDI